MLVRHQIFHWRDIQRTCYTSLVLCHSWNGNEMIDRVSERVNGRKTTILSKWIEMNSYITSVTSWPIKRNNSNRSAIFIIHLNWYMAFVIGDAFSGLFDNTNNNNNKNELILANHTLRTLPTPRTSGFRVIDKACHVSFVLLTGWLIG